jgi:phage/plasmid-associated DNA primase
MPGIPNVMAEGAQIYFRDENREPSAVGEATKSYIARQDSVRSLLQDCTTGTSVAVVGESTLYDAHVRYCDDEMLPAIPKGQFGAALKSMNSHDTRRRGERRWKGLRVREGNEVPDLGFSRFGLDAAVKRGA